MSIHLLAAVEALTAELRAEQETSQIYREAVVRRASDPSAAAFAKAEEDLVKLRTFVRKAYELALDAHNGAEPERDALIGHCRKGVP